MHPFVKSLLSAAYLSLGIATAAQANVVGPGNYSGGYIGAVKSVVVNVPGIGTSYAVHPTHSGCTSSLNAIINTFNAMPNVYITQVIPCHYVPGMGPAVEIGLEPLSAERISRGLQAEQDLRDLYNIDAYERALQEVLQPLEDGSH